MTPDPSTNINAYVLFALVGLVVASNLALIWVIKRPQAKDTNGGLVTRVNYLEKELDTIRVWKHHMSGVEGQVAFLWLDLQRRDPIQLRVPDGH